MCEKAAKILADRMSKDVGVTKDMDPGTNKGVDLGFFNGDYPPWDLERDYEDFELQSRHFPSKVRGQNSR